MQPSETDWMSVSELSTPTESEPGACGPTKSVDKQIATEGRHHQARELHTCSRDKADIIQYRGDDKPGAKGGGYHRTREMGATGGTELAGVMERKYQANERTGRQTPAERRGRLADKRHQTGSECPDGDQGNAEGNERVVGSSAHRCTCASGMLDRLG